ncbi:hypothetical protein ACJX0J_015960, partial [Zea mays]
CDLGVYLQIYISMHNNIIRIMNERPQEGSLYVPQKACDIELHTLFILSFLWNRMECLDGMIHFALLSLVECVCIQ